MEAWARAAGLRVLMVSALVLTLMPTTSVLGNHEPKHPVTDQGLNKGEEKVFAKALKLLLANPDVDLVVTLRTKQKKRAGCRRTGDVYWVYSARGTICFTRKAKGRAWKFKVQVVEGRNPIRKQSAKALATLGDERAASTMTEDEEPRNLISASAVTYPYAYERIAAEFDSPRAGDFAIVPVNTADRGGPGAHGHLGLPQSRTTLLLAGRGVRRTPLSRKKESKLQIKNVDVAPTVASALGINPYFVDTESVARLLNGKPSENALLKRQDGRVLNALLEPVYNTFVVVVDGLRPEDVTPELMPNLHALLDEECAPGGVCATEYEEARAMMVSETNGNHVAMMTGAYADHSGILANDTFDRTAGAEIALDSPALLLTDTLFDLVEQQAPWLRTAGVFGKDKLRSLFDCTRTEAGECGPSTANPEGLTVDHVAPDVLAGSSSSSLDPDLDCPAEPGTGSGYSTNACTMDLVLSLLGRTDPDLTFINLPQVDAFSHLFGAGSTQAQSGVTSADTEIGRLVDKLRTSGRWQRSTVIVTADHNFGDTANPSSTIRLDQALAGAGPSPFEIVSYGGSASVYLMDLANTDGPLSADQQATLKALRDAALATTGVTEALYRLPNETDGGDANTLGEVHPDWHLSTPRAGELFITGEETVAFATGQQDSSQLILGEHGHPTDRHIPFFVMSGGTYVKDGVIAGAGEDETDDTASQPTQAENVDIAHTIAWLLGLKQPPDGQGRVLREAFVRHPRKAERRGEITEPLVNRAAIFMFDQNNSITLHCLVDPATCGEPIPPEAQDEGFIPTLRRLAAEGIFTAFGSVSAWPSVTFPNHNTVGSGAYPGHHGVPNNRFYERETKVVESPIDPQDPQNPVYQGTSALLNEDIETLHEATHRTFGDWAETDGPTSTNAYTASVNEPSARGADYATLEAADSFPNPASYIGTANPSELAQDTTQSCAQSDEGYTTESELDHIGQTQARRLFEDEAEHPIPKYFINNFTLTDGAGHHFGVHTTCQIAAYRDSDRRLTRILDAMASAGVLGETLIVITGDHGSENQDLERRGLPSDFEAVLNEAGITHVMTDWHVYLLTTNIASSQKLKRDVEASPTFTITDDDTGTGIEGAEVSVVDGANEATGTTDAEGKVTLTITPSAKYVTIKVVAAGFNERLRKYRAKRR